MSAITLMPCPWAVPGEDHTVSQFWADEGSKVRCTCGAVQMEAYWNRRPLPSERGEADSRRDWNRKIRDSVDSLLAQAGYTPDSSARHQLAMMNFDAPPKAERGDAGTPPKGLEGLTPWRLNPRVGMEKGRGEDLFPNFGTYYLASDVAAWVAHGERARVLLKDAYGLLEEYASLNYPEDTGDPVNPDLTEIEKFLEAAPPGATRSTGSEYDEAVEALAPYLPDGWYVLNPHSTVLRFGKKPEQNSTGTDWAWSGASVVKIILPRGGQGWQSTLRRIENGRVVPQPPSTTTEQA